MLGHFGIIPPIKTHGFQCQNKPEQIRAMQGFLSPIKTIDISPESTPVIGVVNQLKWLWGLYLQLNWIY